MSVKIKNISTEGSNEDSRNLHKKKSIEILKLMNNEENNIIKGIDSQLLNIDKVVKLCVETIKKNNTVYYLGVGTSGRLGVLDVSEIPTTFGLKRDEYFKAIIAGGIEALYNPYAGDEDSESQSKKDLINNGFKKGDLLIALSASGRSPYAVHAINYAKEIGNQAVTISTSKNTEMSKLSDFK